MVCRRFRASHGVDVLGLIVFCGVGFRLGAWPRLAPRGHAALAKNTMPITNNAFELGLP